MCLIVTLFAQLRKFKNCGFTQISLPDRNHSLSNLPLRFCRAWGIITFTMSRQRQIEVRRERVLDVTYAKQQLFAAMFDTDIDEINLAARSRVKEMRARVEELVT